jgi:hypothetical protein
MVARSGMKTAAASTAILIVHFIFFISRTSRLSGDALRGVH